MVEVIHGLDKSCFRGAMRHMPDCNELIGKGRRWTRESKYRQHFPWVLLQKWARKQSSSWLGKKDEEKDLCFLFRGGRNNSMFICLWEWCSNTVKFWCYRKEREGEREGSKALDCCSWECPSYTLISRTLTFLLCRVCVGRVSGHG